VSRDVEDVQQIGVVESKNGYSLKQDQERGEKERSVNGWFQNYFDSPLQLQEQSITNSKKIFQTNTYRSNRIIDAVNSL